MIIIRNTMILLVIAVSPFVVNAQETENETNYQTDYLEEIGMKNSLKWNVGLISRGTFLLNYERALLSWVSLEAGAGITYTDPLYNFVQKVKDEPLYFADNETTTIEHGYGVAYDFRLRMYPRKLNNMEGFYLGVGIHGRHFNSTTTYKKIEEQTGYEMVDGHILFGLQRESKKIEGLLFDTYCGIGIRNKYKTYLSIDEENDDNTYTIENEFKSNPVIIMGVKIGLPF